MHSRATTLIFVSLLASNVSAAQEHKNPLAELDQFSQAAQDLRPVSRPAWYRSLFPV